MNAIGRLPVASATQQEASMCVAVFFFFPLHLTPSSFFFFFLSGNRVERVQFVRNTINADDDDATCERRIRTYICAGNPINRFKVGTFTGLKSILRRNSRNFSRFSLLPSSPFFISAEISLLTSLRCYFVFQNFLFRGKFEENS